MKIYIFVDIDGVLNNTNRWKEDYLKWGFSSGIHAMDEKNIQNLVKIHRQLKDKYELHYILSSTWRASKEASLIAFSRLHENGIQFDGITDPDLSKDRGELILTYLHNIKDYDLAIALDDDTYDIVPYLNNKFKLVHTSTERGLTRAKAREIKKLIKEAEINGSKRR